MNDDVDVLMITHRRPQYVALSLPRLLDSADERTRVWLWHNGEDADTLRVVESHASHPAVVELVVSPVNQGIHEPKNWMWARSKGAFVSKVDDDCLVDPDWIPRLRHVHSASPTVGVVACWRFYPEDFAPPLALAKTQRLPNGTRIMRNHWVQGSGYLAKRALIDRHGPMRPGESFNEWCIRVALAGAVNGWAVPFVHEEHMDDPRSRWTIFSDDDTFRRYRPLSAHQSGVDTVDEWTAQMRRSALYLQQAPLDLRLYRGWRRKARVGWNRARRQAARIGRRS